MNDKILENITFGPGGGIVKAESGGFCRDDIQLEYARKGTTAELAQAKERIRELEAWAKGIIKEEKLYPYQEWPDCGKPYLLCGACGAELERNEEHKLNCSWVEAKDLGLTEG